MPDELLYSAEEVERRTKGYADEKRTIDAGWMSRVAATAPRDVTGGELHVSRSAFFAGVKYMLDIIRMLMSERATPKVTFDLMNDMEIEIKVFLASDTSDPGEPGPPPGKPN